MARKRIPTESQLATLAQMTSKLQDNAAERHARILAAAKARPGDTQDQIAEQVGVSRSLVGLVLRKAGIPVRKRGHDRSMPVSRVTD